MGQRKAKNRIPAAAPRMARMINCFHSQRCFTAPFLVKHRENFLSPTNYVLRWIKTKFHEKILVEKSCVFGQFYKICKIRRNLKENDRCSSKANTCDARDYLRFQLRSQPSGPTISAGAEFAQSTTLFSKRQMPRRLNAIVP